MYEDKLRGKIIYADRRKQLIDFSKLRYDNITPTDIDGYIEKQNRMFIFFEFKYGDVEMPKGQKTAFTRLVDVLEKAGKDAVLMSCRHDVKDTSLEIDGAEAIVKEYYYKGQWYKSINRTVKDVTDSFMKYINKE